MRKIGFLRLRWLLTGQFGFAPRVMWNSLRELPRYVSNWVQFRRNYIGPMRFAPCFHDRNEEGGSTKSEYFWQDLLVARWIFAANPIEVFDIRPTDYAGPGIVFMQADVMQSEALMKIPPDYCDSLSCLHALEHFGLGRYGDPIDPLGYQKGLSNMIAFLKQGGTFYLSIPIGQERVEFNAFRVFDPFEIIQLTKAQGLICNLLTVISQNAAVEHGPISPERLKILSNSEYNLGIFVFTKLLEDL